MELKKHLPHLKEVWIQRPIYFVTTCTQNRSKFLNDEIVYQILKFEWENALQKHGWAIGNFVVMPDHVHFFCSPICEGKNLSSFIAQWKQWTSKSIIRAQKRQPPVW